MFWKIHGNVYLPLFRVCHLQVTKVLDSTSIIPRAFFAWACRASQIYLFGGNAMEQTTSDVRMNDFVVWDCSKSSATSEHVLRKLQLQIRIHQYDIGMCAC